MRIKIKIKNNIEISNSLLLERYFSEFNKADLYEQND